MRHIIGLMIIDAPHSALNNMGMEPGALTENVVSVKKIQIQQDIYPYVSAQAIRYWWRGVLSEKYNWIASPIIRDAKIARTEADPLTYPDDDVFGYMSAKKVEISEVESKEIEEQDSETEKIETQKPKAKKKSKSKKKTTDITVTRVSPLKNSPLISISPVKLVNDFGVMARQEGNPVPYEHQFYSCVFKGLFSLSIDQVGVFNTLNRAGFQNLREEMFDNIKNNEVFERIDENKNIYIKKQERIKRIIETIDAIKYIYGGAKQTLHLTDVTPKIIILTLIKGGNHLFMNVMNNQKGIPKFSFEALKEVVKDYQDIFETKVYIGHRTGFMDELKEDFIKLSEESPEFFIYGTPNEIIDQFIEELKNNLSKTLPEI